MGSNNRSIKEYQLTFRKPYPTTTDLSTCVTSDKMASNILGNGTYLNLERGGPGITSFTTRDKEFATAIRTRHPNCNMSIQRVQNPYGNNQFCPRVNWDDDEITSSPRGPLNLPRGNAPIKIVDGHVIPLDSLTPSRPPKKRRKKSKGKKKQGRRRRN